jgi:ATP-dependent helicase/nuclease subunit B
VFADRLVAEILGNAATSDFALEDYTILVPNRRGQLALREAFLRALNQKSALLPMIRPIGDVQEEEITFLGAGLDGLDFSAITPAISEPKRLMILKRQIETWSEARESGIAPAEAWRLARELARFMDQVDTEGLSYAKLEKLVPEELAHHWEATLDFLKIVVEHWPLILESEQAQNPAARRNQLMEALFALWQVKPPASPVIAAGSTGTIPTTAKLLKLVSNLEYGAVILPGLDSEMDEDAWENVDVTHPQFAMKMLLETMAVSRDEVTVLSSPANKAKETFHYLLKDALRPAENTNIWRDLGFADMPDSHVFKGVRKLAAPNRRQEAEAIAVAMRASLETPDKTAALVTPDRRLARYVRFALKRWGIEIDDTGGDKALLGPTGRLLVLVSNAVADNFAPISFIAILQHPLACFGVSRADFLTFVRRIDSHVLRGARPKAGLSGIIARVKSVRAKSPDLISESDIDMLSHIQATFEPLVHAFQKGADFREILERHVGVAEAIAKNRDEAGVLEEGADRLWVGEAGRALADGLAELLDETSNLSDFSRKPLLAEEYTALFREIFSDVMVRPKWRKHPRLSILGPIEARLQRADFMILGGLSEGIWPADLGTDPWMSRPMRRAFGLPDRARRIGQAAHDFVQAALADEVLITRSEKIDGAPAVPSRWLFKIEALAGREIPIADEYLSWMAALSDADSVQPVSPPEPRPPVEARPKKLSVTQVETWMRDPYALYAAKILGLRPLEKIDERPNAAHKGTIIHRAFEQFVEETKGQGGDQLELARLTELGEEAFSEIVDQPTVHAFWWPRFLDAAAAFIEHEQTWREGHETVLVEETGTLEFDDFTLTAKADRIDRDQATGDLIIIDYKTGNVPTERRMEAGFAPQLPLEAVIARLGGFPNIPEADIQKLMFWLIKGGAKPLEFKEPIKKPEDLAAVIDAAQEGLKRLITAFSDAGTPYLSNPRPRETGYGDYDHLARVKEWRLGEALDGDAAKGPKSGDGA